MTTLNDYNVVRDGVGVFDLSDMAKIRITGNESDSFLEEMVTCSVELIEEGMGASGILLRADGSIVAICSIFRDRDEFILFTDGGKKETLLDWLTSNAAGSDVVIEDVSDSLGLLSLIGFKAQMLAMEVAGDDIIAIPFMGFEANETTRSKIFRVGNTGEFEYQFLVERDGVDALRTDIMEKGASFDVVCCSNQILDTLMVEMKTINQLKDLEPDTNAIEAGLVWMIDFGKESFIGRDSAFEQKDNLSRKLVILLCDDGDSIPPRALVKIENVAIGFVTNQCFSKRLGRSLVLAYVEEAFGWVGIEFDIETEAKGVRKGKAVSSPTFITRSVKGEAS
ncbi:MAG: glycine cleavage T C-terminal barrel domain-containing protein [Pseudomonadota bacterium]